MLIKIYFIELLYLFIDSDALMLKSDLFNINTIEL